ncbi:Nn.00g024580.m01.CDS01 [Neocucurbitaria sp. VM-36]
MAECNEARLPLTNESVQKWARTNFPGPFRALPRTPRLTWIAFDESSFALSRAIWRSLGRSSHKQLLDIGAYAPGPDLNDEEPTDRVAAHVHEDEAEVSFYRIVETPYGDELQSVKSTSTVAFSAPFCNVGDDTGGSEAIHRVSALIRYYFLAAGHVKELLRSKLDPTMFTRNFKDACSWIENGGERPIAMPSRRLSVSTMVTSQDNVAIRPKRSSTISTISRSSADAARAPAIHRSVTDSISMKVKRERDVESPARPTKHPRRTLSEQIRIPALREQEPVKSPRSPAPERVNRALSERIQDLKMQKSELEQRMAQEKRNHETELERVTKELAGMKTRLASVESASEQLQGEMQLLRKRVEQAEQDAVVAKDELLYVRKGLAHEHGEAARKWSA